MAAEFERSPWPPGTGATREAVENHMEGWNRAVDEALRNIGRAPGRYHVKVELSAVVDIENPGKVIEYIATIT